MNDERYEAAAKMTRAYHRVMKRTKKQWLTTAVFWAVGFTISFLISFAMSHHK